MDWSRIDTQLGAVQDAVLEAAGQAAIEVERARRALDRLEALERLLDEHESLSSGAPAPQSGPPPTASGAGGSRRGGGRASMRRSPLVDLFRDSTASDGPPASVEGPPATVEPG